MPPRVVFFAPPGVTALDLIGPLQAFQAAGWVGAHPYRIEVCALSNSVRICDTLHFSRLVPYQRIKLRPDDILFVAGCHITPLLTPKFLREHRALFEWIRQGWRTGATICSICTGSYLLAEAGILDGLACTSHWEEADHLQSRYPKITVRKGLLFVEAGNVCTSAGIASGIDLAIHLLGRRHGQKVAFAVARYLVVYLRRSGNFAQESVYLKYRNHLDDLVHRAQSILIENLETPPRLDQLAEQVGASPRNLSRRFRQSLDLSIGEYRRELRLEHAGALLQETGAKVEEVARACGFNGSRQLRNMFQARFGRSPTGRGILRSR